MATLKDVLPREFNSYLDTPAYKMKDIEVISEHMQNWKGGQKNVYFWVKLANGKSVGWNESPSHGWSFPVITTKE